MPYLLLGAEIPPSTRTLAIVRSSGDDDGYVLGLCDGVEEAPKFTPATPLLEEYEKELKAAVGAAKVGRAFSELVSGLRHGYKTEDLPPPLQKIFARMLETTITASEITLGPNAHYEVCPNPDPKTRDAIGVFSPAGGGKSVWCASFTQKYRRLFPDRPVFILSKNTVADDPAWLALFSDNIDIARDMPPQGSLLIFDDLIDAYDGKMKKAVQRTVQDALQIGRRHNVSVLVTSHQLTDGMNMRAILHDLHSCILFPSHTPTHSLRYFLNKIGLDGDHIIGTLRKAGRAVQVSIRAPQFYLGDKECKLVE
jgi:hypothetical protein